jgi:hypothetical protein
MRDTTIAKGAELGIWDAEQMAAEVADESGGSMMPFSGGSVMDNPLIDATRNDPFALGSFCLGTALVVASRFGPEETFGDTAKRTMGVVGIFLEGLFLGRLTRGMVTKTQLAEKEVAIHRLETLVDAMEYDKAEAMKEATKKTKRQMYSTNGGVIDVVHPMMGGNTMNAMQSSTTPAFGQAPIAMRRAENVFF